MPSNRAAWLVEAGKPFEVRDAPMPKVKDDEVLVKVIYSNVGPGDMAQAAGYIPAKHMPMIAGCDIAGRIVEVGKSVKDFKAGQRIIAISAYFDWAEDDYGAYQLYVAVKPSFILAVLPDAISYDVGVVIPLSIGVAAQGLYAKTHLALPFPELKSAKKDRKETILVTGGATTVGIIGVQLAALSGYSVVATASKGNAELVKRMGATTVVDYRSETANDDIISTIESLGPLKGILAVAKSNMMDPRLPDSFEQLRAVLDAQGANAAQIPVAVANFAPEGFPYKTNFIGGTCPFRTEEVGPFPQADGYIGEYLCGVDGFVSKALRDGSLVAEPKPHLAGTGLEGVQAALDLYKSGSLSAAKAVIRIQDE